MDPEAPGCPGAEKVVPGPPPASFLVVGIPKKNPPPELTGYILKLSEKKMRKQHILQK
jgi:hypothetical protein